MTKAFAASYLLYPENSSLIQQRLQEKNISFTPVFNQHERKIFKGLDLPLHVLRIETDLVPAKLKQILAPLQYKLEINEKASLQSDHLLDQQWALSNSGAPYIERTSDIDVNVVEGVAGEDISLSSVEEKPSKAILIAVVDSGVDLDHPDLQKNIYRSPKECEALAAYEQCMKNERDKTICFKTWANHDADGNGYPMDCHGYNIAGNSLRFSRSQGSHIILDKSGHGTHIAGIIGAVKNNGFGVRGAMENVKILPVQINGAVNQRQLGTNETAIDLIAKGVLYAIKTRAQVINVSLGWALNEDSTLMRKVVELARQHNVLIVAAGGNSGHASPTYPCSYDYVLCVGAHGVDGKLTHFSNYGTSIDIIAPGENILSTWPTLMRPRKFTEGAGFEFQNGTSFASPYVAAALGILLNQGISPQDAVARLLNGTRPNKSSKSLSRHGNLDISQAIKQPMKSFLYPLNKAPYLIHWKRGEARTFNLKMINLGQTAPSVSLEVSSMADDVTMLDHQFEVTNWHPQEEKTFQVAFNSPDDMESDIYFKLKIKSAHEQKQYFIHAMALTIVTPEYDANSSHISIENGDFLKNATLMAIKNFDNQIHQSEFVALKSIQGHTHVALVKNLGTKFEVSPSRRFPIKNPALLHLARVDIDQNGNSEYVFAAANLDEQGSGKLQKTTFYIFDQNLNPTSLVVAKNNQYNNQMTVMPGSFIWTRHQNRMVPTWINLGLRPEHERPRSTPWKPAPPERSLYRIFYLTPEGLATVAMPDEGSSAVAFLDTPEAEKHRGTPLVILSKGFGFYKSYELHRLQGGLHKVQDITLSTYHDLLGLDPLPHQEAPQAPNIFFNSPNSLGDQRITSLFWTSNKLQVKHTRVRSFNRHFPIFNILNIFDSGVFYQTQFHIGFYDLESGTHNVVNSKVAPDQRYHRIIGNRKAIYLSSRFTPSLGSEVLSLRYDTKVNGHTIYRSSLWRMIGAKGCEAIGFITESSLSYMYYLCEAPYKFIKIPY